jgi:PhzF family phenazine biosynthesis protein
MDRIYQNPGLMKHVKALVINAFSDGGRGGNPAGLVLDADQLSTEQKLHIAAQVGLSETAFVSASEIAELKLEFFTPTRQIAHCGHATIAAFSYLKQTGRITGNTSSKETIDGIRNIYYEGEPAFMEQTAPIFRSLELADQGLALSALGLKKEDLLPGYRPEIVHTGNAFLIIAVRSEKLLKTLNPDLNLISQLSEKYGLIGLYPYTPASESGFAAVSRMFAPFYGIPEEAATGMAAGPLAAYLDRYESGPQAMFTIRQGSFMQPPSPSKILVRLEREGALIRRIFAGGTAFADRQLIIPVPESLTAN